MDFLYQKFTYKRTKLKKTGLIFVLLEGGLAVLKLGKLG
jgi:hypothetical protein